MYRQSTVLAIAVFISPLFGETIEQKDNKFRLSAEVIKRLPTLGEVIVSTDSGRHKVEMGSHFVGDTVHAVIAVKNAFKNQLIIESIGASCGCTAAFPSEKRVDAGAQTKIIVKVSLRTAGQFAGSLLVHSNLGVFRIALEAIVVQKIELVQSKIVIEKESDTINVKLKFNDKSLIRDGSTYRLEGIFDAKFVTIDANTGEATFRLLLKGIQSSFNRDIAVVPVVNSTQFPPVQLVLETKGFLSSATKEVYGRDSEGDFSFRLLIKGDLDSLAVLDVPIELNIADSAKAIKTKARVEATRVGGVLSLIVVVESSILDGLELAHAPAELIVGDVKVPFFINRI